MTELTAAQRQALQARGNVLVVAGAGTGKTSTVVARALRLVLEEGSSLQQMLLVTFTEAAATEMRQRIRAELLRRLAAEPLQPRWAEQLALLDTAWICTLHSFCLHLVSEHACELGLDPLVTVLDESQTRPLLEEALDELLARHYRQASPLAEGLRDLVRRQGRGAEERIRALVVRLHRYAQTLPDPAAWLEAQTAMFSQPEPDLWRRWLHEGWEAWRQAWLPVLQAQPPENPVARLCAEKLARAVAAGANGGASPALREVLAQVLELDQSAHWPRGTKGKFRPPIAKLFEEAQFLRDLAGASGGMDPLRQDWEWVRHPMLTLLQLTREFTAAFTRAKRELGGVDFADLEQLSLRLLLEPGSGRPSALARAWQERLEHVFVDEYQDINAAQDAILSALSRQSPSANRFLVGDVKQSIYRFRLADPGIFRRYEQEWRARPEAGVCVPLTDNFRSHEAVLDFVNALFGALMRPTLGGVAYDAQTQLQFGDRARRACLTRAQGMADGPPVELHLLTLAEAWDSQSSSLRDPISEGRVPRVPNSLPSPRRPCEREAEETAEDQADGSAEAPDLTMTEREARLVALRLRELREQGRRIWDKDAGQFRPARWSDMAVLLRAPAGKVEAYAQEFHRAGVPLQAPRGGFLEALEIMDLRHLLMLLDNPLQDVPLLAVLRSPLVGLSLDELIEVRAHSRERRWWTALRAFHQEAPAAPESRPTIRSAWAKVDEFLRRFESWREWVRLVSLSACLERALQETHYEALLRAGERGAERAANVRRFLDLARAFDPYQRQGLFRFLRFLEAQEEAEQDFEPAPVPTAEAVQLLSIHKSKGLEFPIVVVADLGKRFNLAGLREDVLPSQDYGLCPQVVPPSGRRYPSLPYWLAQQRERRELLGEELRLLYVAMTRARDMLLLTGLAGRHEEGPLWSPAATSPIPDVELLQARCYLDWLLLWLPQVTSANDWRTDAEGESRLLRWQVWRANDARLTAPPQPERDPAAPASGELTSETVSALEARLAWSYPWTAATTTQAKTSVSELKRRQAEMDEEEAVRLFAGPGLGADFRLRGRATPRSDRVSAVDRGIAHHALLEHVPLEQAADEAVLRAEAQRLAQAGVLTPAQVAVLDYAALAAFWRSDLGRRIRAEAGGARRELEFTAGFSADDLTALGLPLPSSLPSEETIVVQGVVDLAVVLPDRVWLVDFKTDEVTRQTLAAKVQHYTPQLQLYGLALERILKRPVTERWLHFLSLGESVSVPQP